MQNGENNAPQVYLRRRLFLLFYRATALQRGKSFPSCAWRMPLLHRDFHLLSHSIFLFLHHFYTISFDFGVTSIFFTPNYTIDLHLHHSRYSFRQVHFRHLILHVRHFCDMIVDIHSDLRIRVSLSFLALPSTLSSSADKLM